MRIPVQPLSAETTYSQWDWCTFLSERFPIELMEIYCRKACVLKEKGIQSARILSKVRSWRGCYTAFCWLTAVVEHIDQNILALFVFQRNKMELYLLCVSFPRYSFLPWSIAHRWGSIDYLVVSVCVWVGEFRVSVCMCGCICMWSLSHALASMGNHCVGFLIHQL